LTKARNFQKWKCKTLLYTGRP